MLEHIDTTIHVDDPFSDWFDEERGTTDECEYDSFDDAPSEI